MIKYEKGQSVIVVSPQRTGPAKIYDGTIVSVGPKYIGIKYGYGRPEKFYKEDHRHYSEYTTFDRFYFTMAEYEEELRVNNLRSRVTRFFTQSYGAKARRLTADQLERIESIINEQPQTA